MEKFFLNGSKAGIQPKHAGKLRLQLFALDNAKHPSGYERAGMETSSAGRDIQRSLSGQRSAETGA
ncbi:MAG: hypothetical protein ABSA29_17755 [Terriglobales bacterium]